MHGGSLANEWRSMFDDEEHLESRAFPPLHKIILNLSTTVTLRQQLTLTTSNIDDQDSDGRTALSWAAQRGDIAAVSDLLKFNANPNLCSHRGQSPLHWAAQNNTGSSARMIATLLEAGADAKAADYWNRTAVLYACHNQDDLKCLELLCYAESANINDPDCRGRTPLGYAASKGRAQILEFLLNMGADLSIADSWGYTPLLEALRLNYHSAIRVLLSHHRSKNIPLLGKTKVIKDMSIPHLLALHADVDTLKIFVSWIEDADSEIMGLDSINDEGVTALELFRKRERRNPELEDAWQSLVSKIVQNSTKTEVGSDGERRREREATSEGQDGESEDGFYDAAEYQE